MVNCGRCGRPVYDGQPICKFCRKTINREATKKTNRLNKKKDQEMGMFMNIASPGGDSDEDAASVWVDDEEINLKQKKKR